MTTSFEAALGDQLRNAALRGRRSQRPQVLLVGAVAAVSISVAVATALSSSDPASADVEVSRHNGRIEVLLTNLESDGNLVENALRSEGLDVLVTEVPTGPSRSGRFTGIVSSEPGIVDVHDEAAPGEPFLGFSIPDDWAGQLEIGLGRLAGSKENYEAFTDAFAPGEPLACTDAHGRTLAASVPQLEQLDVLVQPIDAKYTVALVPLADAPEAYGTWYISAGTAMSATSVILDVTIDPPAPLAGNIEGPDC